MQKLMSSGAAEKQERSYGSESADDDANPDRWAQMLQNDVAGHLECCIGKEENL